MKGGIKNSASRSQIKPERKIIEKNRRNQMKILSNHLYSLVPPNFISKGGCQVSDRLDRTIEYIQTLKDNLEISKNKKEKLLSEKRSRERSKKNNVCTRSHNIQINQISHDLDAVLVTGLSSYSSFCDVVQLLDRYSAEVTVANFSRTAHSTFHIRQKQIEAEDLCNRLMNLVDGQQPNITELCEALLFNEVNEDLRVLDFDIHSSVWGCELGVDGQHPNITELCEALLFNEVNEDLSVLDFDIHSSVWGCELGVDGQHPNITELCEALLFNEVDQDLTSKCVGF